MDGVMYEMRAILFNLSEPEPQPSSPDECKGRLTKSRCRNYNRGSNQTSLNHVPHTSTYVDQICYTTCIPQLLCTRPTTILVTPTHTVLGLNYNVGLRVHHHTQYKATVTKAEFVGLCRSEVQQLKRRCTSIELLLDHFRHARLLH